jgi:PhzF family phenazine biosynthesis protein
MVSKELLFYQVDAFSTLAFSGNPAAVILLNDSSYISDDQRQSIAAENNLAETAYVVPVSNHRIQHWPL